MIDIFAPEFLLSLRQELKPKTKASKAVLEAIRDLTSQKEASKTQIAHLETRVKQLEEEAGTLRRENEMLAEMLSVSKKDLDSRLQMKETRLQNAIELEARLTAENESLRKQLEDKNMEVLMIKELAAQHRNYSSKADLSEAEGSERCSATGGGSAAGGGSACQLAAYLFSARGKSQNSLGRGKQDDQVSLQGLAESSEIQNREADIWKSQIDVHNEAEMDKVVELFMEQERDTSQP